MKKKGFTLIELLVVIAIIAMLLAILMPALSRVKKIAQRVVCGTNLKGLGTAQVVYAHDYNGQFTVQGRGGSHNWIGLTGGWENTAKNWAGGGNISVGASLYLLVREADVSPKSFVCPSSQEREFSGRNPGNLDIVELWDFGNPNYVPATGSAEGPAVAVSYSYHLPYNTDGRRNRYAADSSRSAAFAVMADKNPYFDQRSTQYGSGTSNQWNNHVARMAPYYDDATYTSSSWEVREANSHPHDREGQNVLYADGHTSYQGTPDVGVQDDNIYTVRGGAGDFVAQVRRGDHGSNSGYNVAVGTQKPVLDLLTQDDSFLVNDSAGGY